MTPHEPLKMMWSYTDGWLDLVRLHPTVARMFLFYVVPMSLIPAAMIFYAGISNHELLVPRVSSGEALMVAVAFLLAELAMVPLMAMVIQQMGELVDIRPDFHDSFMLAAVAPTPLWLASLALFLPSTPALVLLMALAWIGCAALIYHGTPPLFGLQDHRKSRLLSHFVIGAGVMAWVTLMVVLAIVLSLIVGYR
ncbi:MAG: Yip1 family protein [Candidatus Methylophosphatis roskildensis]